MNSVREFRTRLKRVIRMIQLDAYTRKYIEHNKRRHTFHIVDNSPWPIALSLCLMVTAVGFVMLVHEIKYGGHILSAGLSLVLTVMTFWLQDVVTEGTYLGHHTKNVQKMLKTGFLLFLVTEVMFFAGFFWAFFHASLSPTGWIGAVWPPLGIKGPDPLGIPLLNTGILILSGVSYELAIRAIKRSDRKQAEEAFLLTLFLGLIFMGLQIYEYFNVLFRITDGIYGASFFMLTGLHFFHVLVGGIFITVGLIRFEYGHFNKHHFIGLKVSGFYWHFVDIVWVFLYVSVYWWGQNWVDTTDKKIQVLGALLKTLNEVIKY